MKTYEIITDSAEQTMKIAYKLASHLHQGDVIVLEGDLGAGKTTFTKGLAKGLGITRNVNSPTFTIIKEYQGKVPLYHMDVYRLENGSEDLGFQEYFEGNGITVVEWAHLIADQLPAERLIVRINHISECKRKLMLEPIGVHYEQVCKEIISK
ncbi:tRNA (adenosine(37)-N6)-threonylcarbamoyltransferase complex ATPase subunit type 1 TsaE [Cytobacillus sp. IB215316]|uniref:tRNA (adenosine(37)-N6)-threonylcarbamoyltransferase complex ATPase subunit type 1 TsaE n=1 Tax=Cytobacillus sp. IB215316 TaxID=3097354 RepID=UPI002A12B228|nr:tRNA (adenosine(37)-N6)-threonylcarbamoyltransferase complex ATPase subunit type 1 TsaE [Cytobacillus sp. IB215316]MDX8363306.1 tRNA (adenosine(37)-N6)-threonylcarbamoyltransferase complex ATPase subunit type 1 TsaE [Cytobacillus sp. IB215316]